MPTFLKGGRMEHPPGRGRGPTAGYFSVAALVCCLLLAACWVLVFAWARPLPVRFWLLFAAGLGLLAALGAMLWTAIRTLRDIQSTLEHYDEEGAVTHPRKTKYTLSNQINERFAVLNSRSQQEYSYQLLEKQAQMDAMQGQIQPHFLYNALDSIRGLAVEEHAARTADMAEALAVLYRSLIGRFSDLLTLEQEIQNIDNYVKIQQYRFGNRFSLEKDIGSPVSDMMMNYRLPKLTLQPIVENAIYHGIDKLAGSGVIRISAYTTQSRLVISIKDNGLGMDEATLLAMNRRLMEGEPGISESASKNNGIALDNVNARIKMLFGAQYGLTVFSTKNVGTEVQLSLPLLEETI